MKKCVNCINSKDSYYTDGSIIYEICRCELLPNNITVNRFNPGKWCPLEVNNILGITI